MKENTDGQNTKMYATPPAVESSLPWAEETIFYLNCVCEFEAC